MNTDDVIIAFCENQLELLDTRDAIVFENVKVTFKTDRYYKVVFDACLWRDTFIYEISSEVEVSEDQYVNELLDNYSDN